MVEDRHKGFHERRHLLPQLPRDGPAKGYQDPPGISIRYRQYAVHRTSRTAHPGAIRREYRARLSPIAFFCEKSGRCERSCVAQRNETKRVTLIGTGYVFHGNRHSSALQPSTHNEVAWNKQARVDRDAAPFRRLG